MLTYVVDEFNIHIGNHPCYHDNNREQIIDHYDVFMNVSDDPANYLAKGKPVYWHPIVEFGYWTYQPFFWARTILDDCVTQKKNVYLHCHAGLHRSPMIAYTYLLSLGLSPEEAFSKFAPTYKDDANWLEQTLQNDIEYGRIPADVVDFMKAARGNPELSMMGLMKKRGELDLPAKTMEKAGLRKPVGEAQVKLDRNGLFS